MCSDWKPVNVLDDPLSQWWPNLLSYHLVLSTIPIEVDFCAFTRICQEVLRFYDFGDHYSRTLLYPTQWARLALIVQQTNCLLFFFLIPRKAYFCFSKKSRPPVLTYYSSVAEFSTDLVVLKVNEKCIHDVEMSWNIELCCRKCFSHMTCTCTTRNESH